MIREVEPIILICSSHVGTILIPNISLQFTFITHPQSLNTVGVQKYCIQLSLPNIHESIYVIFYEMSFQHQHWLMNVFIALLNT